MPANRQTSQRARSSTTRLRARIHAAVTGAPRKIDTDERWHYRAAAKSRIARTDPLVIRKCRRGSWDQHDCVAPRAGDNDSASQHNVSDSLARALLFRTQPECNLPQFRQRPSRPPPIRRSRQLADNDEMLKVIPGLNI
jgi:hypothetical protein